MTMIQKVVLMTHFVIVDNDGHSKLEKPARLTIRVFSSVKWKKQGDGNTVYPKLLRQTKLLSLVCLESNDDDDDDDDNDSCGDGDDVPSLGEPLLH